MVDLKGKKALVTGATGGIGGAIAKALHDAGAQVALSGSRQEKLDALVAEFGGDTKAIACNLTDPASVDTLVGKAEEALGGLDILICNAGITRDNLSMRMKDDEWQQVIDVNLTGLFLCTKAVAAAMILRGRGGRIVNITSIDALHPSAVGLAHYDASKHGAWGFTKNVALELAPHGICVNAIAPGGVHTPGTAGTDDETLRSFEQMIPMGRMGEADEVARAALFLASDLSSYTTGSQLVVDGGRLLR